MKKVFALAVIVGFLLMGSLVSAWQNPCSATDNAYVCEGFTLEDWVETGPHFSPAPECAGTVSLWASDGTGWTLKYVGNNGIMTIAGVPCRINNQGNLECKVITQAERVIPEESTILIFGQQE